jgi:hypothetical protein
MGAAKWRTVGEYFKDVWFLIVPVEINSLLQKLFFYLLLKIYVSQPLKYV